MFLSRIHLDLRSKDARRDLASPYQLHSTLCRAFSPPDRKCQEGAFLWRLEPETDTAGYPRILIQSRKMPDWTGVGIKDWLAYADPSVDIVERLRLDTVVVGQRFRYRLRANPCVTRKGKRQGLLQRPDQERWISRKGRRHGFSLPRLSSFGLSEACEDNVDVHISQEQMLRAKQHDANSISLFSVLYDGTLTVTEPREFRQALETGIGHGKVMGLGLLSVAPII